MRNISDITLNLLNGKIAIDPAFIIAVQWGTGGEKTWYSDRTIEDFDSLPWIIKMGDMDSIQNSDSDGQTNAISITLSDLNGSLKSIFDQSDIHKKLVWVYQYFVGTSIGDKFLLFSGQISTPIIWDEGSRTLAFEVVTRLENQEIGYSAERGNFSSIAHSLIGKPWPMVFGKVLHVPGMALQEIPGAFTVEPFSIPDESLRTELMRIGREIVLFPKYNIAKICDERFTANDVNCEQEGANEQAFQEGTALQAQLDSLQKQQKDLSAKLQQQELFAVTRVNLIPTTQITQPYTGMFKVGTGLFNGHLDNKGGYINTTPLLEPGNYDIQKQLIKAGYQFNNSGTQVTIVGNYPIVHVVSIIPGTVLGVYAYHSFRGLKKLVKLPAQYYTVSIKNFGPGAETTLCVTLNQPLSTVTFLYNLTVQNWENNFGQYLPPHLVAQVDWEDDIYVTVQSDVGSNPVDIMIYIINRFTTNSYDVANFDSVRPKVDITPMNFLYQSLDNAMSILSQLAYQARCAIYLVEDVFHLRYLPEAGEEVSTISESDVLVNSLQVTTTPTESLVTVYTATFRPDYTPTFSEPVQAIFRFNVNKYGYHRETHDFFAFNSFDVVEKVATFWMIRKSMTWKLLKCKLHLNKLNLEVFDTILLNFNHPYIANTPVKGMITNAQYNIDEKAIMAEIWTPVRLGEMIPYTASWDTGIEEIEVFPTYRDIQAGSAGGISGGEALELPPMTQTIYDIQLNQRDNYTRGDKTPLRGYSSNSSGNPELPLTNPAPYPIPIADPSFDHYLFGGEVKTVAQAPTLELSRVYPARIEGYQKSDGGHQIYNVTIYRKGIEDEGSQTAAKQLQIDPDDRIPEGTWVTVMETESVSKDKTTGIVTSKTERTMQVPVWLF